MATANVEGLKYTADVDSLYFPDSGGSTPRKSGESALQSSDSSTAELSDLKDINIKRVKDSMDHSECHSISSDSSFPEYEPPEPPRPGYSAKRNPKPTDDDDSDDEDSSFPDYEAPTPPRRRTPTKRNPKAQDDDDSDDEDVFHEDTLEEDQVDEDYRLALELDREMNGDIDRLEQLLWNLDEEFPTVEEEPEPLYPVGTGLTTECQICLVEKFLHKRTCCQYPVCEECLIMYFEFQINQANVKIACPHCKSFVYKTEIFDKLSVEMQKKFYQFIVDANKDPLKKTCPRCSAVHSIEEWQRKDKHVKKYGLKVDCAECHFEWCFQCQSPLHAEMKCKDYQKGEKLVKEWASQVHGEQANARRCPKCKIWIQRSTGCDHMTCNQCNSQFCYRCGGRYFSVKFIGSHHNRWSILGCKNNLMPERPVSRRLVRGSVFACQIVGGLVLGSLAVAAAGAVAGVAVVALPIYGSVRLHRKITQQKRLKRITQEKREAQERYQQRIMDLKSRGDPYLEQWNRNQRLRFQRGSTSPAYPRSLPRSSSTPDDISPSDIGATSAVSADRIDRMVSEVTLDLESEGWDSESDQENERSRPSVHTSMAEIHSTAELSYKDEDPADPAAPADSKSDPKSDPTSDADSDKKSDYNKPAEDNSDVKRIHHVCIDCVISL